MGASIADGYSGGTGMFGLGIGELLIILAVMVLLFSRRLPDLGASFGAAIRKFKKALNEADEIDVTPPDQSKKRSNAKHSD